VAGKRTTVAADILKLADNIQSIILTDVAFYLPVLG
jgi:hypothetical protein